MIINNEIEEVEMLKKKFIIIISLFSNIKATVECSLQEKLTQSSEKIAALRQDVKTGKKAFNEVYDDCNSCSNCSSCDTRCSLCSF
ncbi:MAG TPA: hypothetical protein VL201_04395 [Patescibacteria group bacterium]|jgi:hypothetical protein|nr:hypothetical protein [Patescibacteria group bacterium]